MSHCGSVIGKSLLVFIGILCLYNHKAAIITNVAYLKETKGVNHREQHIQPQN